MNNDFNDINNSSNLSFDKAWASIKPSLDAEGKRREKRKRRFIIFWWFTAAIVGGGLLFKGSEELGIRNKELVKKEFGMRNKELSNDNKLPKSANTNQQKIALKVENKNLLTDKIISNYKQLSKELKTTNYEEKIIFKTVDKNIKLPTKNKKQKSSITTTDEFKNIPSYTSFSQLKSNKNTDITIDNSLRNKINNTNTKNIITSQKPVDTIKTLAKTNEISKKQETKNQTKSIKKAFKTQYGLQWNLPIQNGVNFLDINTVKQPVTLLIPAFWISKKVGKKHSFQLQLNPYSQYFLNNKAIVSHDVYTTNIQTGSQLDNKPEAITYSEVVSFNKLMSIEAGLMYQYQLSPKIKLGIGISNSWVLGALLQNKITRNNILVTRDSLYGINKQDKEFSNLQSTFISGKLEAQYQFKNISIGISCNKPISTVFTPNVLNKLPINTNLFFKLSIK